MSAYDATSLARRERIEKLKADIKSLEEGTRRLEGGATDKAAAGQEIKAFRNTGGDRRYITGIKMRGKHVLILLDRSASMLHQDLVNVILLRNSDEAKKRAASKWRRALDTTNWIVTQLPAGAQFQVYGFNTKAEAVLASSAGKWQDANDPLARSRNIEALNAIVPQDGTSLINAFAAVKQMSPLPDQVILITDGLPAGQDRGPAQIHRCRRAHACSMTPSASCRTKCRWTRAVAHERRPARRAPLLAARALHPGASC
jgi:hypothetical protein